MLLVHCQAHGSTLDGLSRVVLEGAGPQENTGVRCPRSGSSAQVCLGGAYNGGLSMEGHVYWRMRGQGTVLASEISSVGTVLVPTGVPVSKLGGRVGGK